MAVGITLVVVVVVAVLYAMICTRYRERWCAREGFEDLGKVSNEWYQRLSAHQQCYGRGDMTDLVQTVQGVIYGAAGAVVGLMAGLLGSLTRRRPTTSESPEEHDQKHST